MTKPRRVQLEPYDQGYRDGWHDIHVTPVRRRAKRRRKKPEYALGYEHGRIDGATWGQFPEWSDYASPPVILDDPIPLHWRRSTEREGYVAEVGLRPAASTEGPTPRGVSTAAAAA